MEGSMVWTRRIVPGLLLLLSACSAGPADVDLSERSPKETAKAFMEDMNVCNLAPWKDRVIGYPDDLEGYTVMLDLLQGYSGFRERMIEVHGKEGWEAFDAAVKYRPACFLEGNCTLPFPDDMPVIMEEERAFVFFRRAGIDWIQLRRVDDLWSPCIYGWSQMFSATAWGDNGKSKVLSEMTSLVEMDGMTPELLAKMVKERFKTLNESFRKESPRNLKPLPEKKGP
jgi:hypothetical protein